MFQTTNQKMLDFMIEATNRRHRLMSPKNVKLIEVNIWLWHSQFAMVITMALIEIDVLPNLKMGRFSMAMLKNQRVDRLVIFRILHQWTE